MSEKHYVGSSAADVEVSQAYEPYTKVCLIVGEDGDTQLCYFAILNGAVAVAATEQQYEAAAGRGMEASIETFIGDAAAGQALAQSILARITNGRTGGYVYKPYSATDAFVPEGAELGDGITIGGIYSVLAQQDIQFDGLLTSGIGATGADETENEFGNYTPSSDRKLNRKINNVATSFSVRTGKIESVVTNGLYDTTGVSIDYYGYGAPSVDDYPPAEHSGDVYLDLLTGYYYTCDGTDWDARSQNPLPLITDQLSSRITQTAGDITLQVQGNYAAEWSTSGSKDGYYYKNDTVKVTATRNGTTTLTFYRCKGMAVTPQNPDGKVPASDGYKPPNTTYWESLGSSPTVQSLINLSLDGISISYSGSGENNSAYIKLMRDGVEIGGGVVKLGTVVADSVSANNVTAGTISADDIILSGYSLSAFANDTGYQNATQVSSTAESVAGTVVASTVTADYVNALGITAEALYAGTVALGNIGTMTLTGSSSSSGAVDISSWWAMRLTAANGALFASASSYINLYSAMGAISMGGNTYPQSSSHSLGTSAYPWNDVYASNSHISTSDRNKKKNIDYGLSEYDGLFDGLKPCTFKFKDAHNRTHMGLIAQDVEDLIEDCSMTTADVAAFIKSWNEKTKTYDYALRYGEFIPLLIWEVQQLKARVKELEK